MSLFDLQPIEAEPFTATETQRHEYTVRIKQTRSGRDIMVCTADTVPAEVIAEACAKKMPLFSGIEVLRMRDCDPEMVNHIMDVKLAYPGCTVQQILNGDVQS